MPTISSIKRNVELLRNYKLSALKIERRQSDIVFRNLVKFKHLLERAASLGIFDDEIRELASSLLYTTTSDTLVIATNQGAETLADTSEYLHFAIDALTRLIPQLQPEEPPECIYIRFPDSEDISTITHDLQEIEKAVLQIVTHQKIAGLFKVLRWESGCLWIHVFVATAEAVTVVAAAAWSAAVIAKKCMEFRIFQEHARGLTIKNDSLQDLEAAQAKLLEELVTAESRNLTEKYLAPEGNEEVVQRVKYAIKTISELIRRGGEVAPALSAPEEVRNLFPDYKTLSTISSSIKQIEENSSKNETKGQP